MITNYNDPRVILTQVYKSTTTGVTPTLGACVVGPHYLVRDYQGKGQKMRMDTSAYQPSVGITAMDYPATESTDKAVDLSSVKVFVKNAQLQFESLQQSDSISFYVNGTTKYDSIVATSGGSAVIFAGTNCTFDTDIQVGDGVVAKILIGTQEKTITTQVIGFLENTSGNKTVCVLDKALPTGTTKISSVVFTRQVDGYVDSGCVTKTSTKIGVSANATITTTIGQAEYGRVIISGQFYAEYRVRSAAYCNKYGILAGQESVEEVLGKVCPQNPLGLAVYAAAYAADSNFVYFVAIDEDEDASTQDLVSAYSAAVDLVADVTGIHGIVPCTNNVSVLKALFTFVQTQSQEEIPYYKYLYAGADIPETTIIKQNLTVASSSDSGDVTKLSFSGSPFISVKNIVAGDIVRKTVNGEVTDYTVTFSDNQSVLKIKGNYGTGLTGSVVTILHTVTSNQDAIEELVEWKPIADKRCLFAICDTPMNTLGQYVSGYCVAAAFAGLRSASEPQAPLSNVQLPGIISAGLKGISASQSKILGAYGFLRVGLDAQGNTIVKRQLTSAATGDVNYDEQSVVCDIDSVCLTIKNTGKDYVGNSNITTDLLTILEVQLSSVLNSFLYAQNVFIGPRLTSVTLEELKQDQVNKDRVYATIKGTPPYPFNQFRITFYLN